MCDWWRIEVSESFSGVACLSHLRFAGIVYLQPLSPSLLGIPQPTKTRSTFDPDAFQGLSGERGFG